MFDDFVFILCGLDCLILAGTLLVFGDVWFDYVDCCVGFLILRCDICGCVGYLGFVVW